MKIYAKTKQHFDGREEYYNRLPLPSQVKRLGDYLGKKKETRFMGVYKVQEPPNQYIIYMTIMYQVPAELRKEMKKYRKEFGGKEEDIYMQDIYLNITTYSGKYIRVNVISLDEYEKTLGYLRLDPLDLISLPTCKQKVREFITDKIKTEYHAYEVEV